MSIIGLKFTGQNSLRTVMLGTSTVTEIFLQSPFPGDRKNVENHEDPARRLGRGRERVRGKYHRGTAVDFENV